MIIKFCNASLLHDTNADKIANGTTNITEA